MPDADTPYGYGNTPCDWLTFSKLEAIAAAKNRGTCRAHPQQGG